MALYDNFERARQRAKTLQSSLPKAISARYDRKSGRIVIELSSKLSLSFSPDDVQGLQKAKPSHLDEIEITPSGFGIHFPKLDADI
jgi:predicted component of type VI protein secretion system